MMKTHLPKILLILMFGAISVVSSGFAQADAAEDLTVNDKARYLEGLRMLEEDSARLLYNDEIPVPDDSPQEDFIQNINLSKSAKRADISWDGGASTQNWNDAANWSGDAVPGSGDNVTIGSSYTVQLIDGTDGACNNITINGSLIIGSKTLTAGGNVTISSGGSLSLSGTIYVGGNWSNSGDFSPNSGSYVRLNGSSNQSIGASNFYHLYIQGSATTTAGGSLDVDGEFRIYNGSTFDPSTYDHYLGGHWRNDGTISLGTGTFYLDGTEWQSVYSNYSGGAPGTWNLNDVAIIGSSGSVGIYDTLSVNGDFSVAGGQSVYLMHYASITNPSEGIINGNGGTFTLEANAGLVIRTQTGSTDDNFPNNFNTVDLAYGSTSSVVYYQADNDQIIRSQDGDGDQIMYGRLRLQYLSDSGFPTKTPDGNLDINQYLYIGPQVTFDVTSGNYGVNVWGYWYNYGTFTARGGTVTLDGEYQQITGDNATTFNNLTITGSSGKVLVRNTTVNGTCSVQSGVSYFNLQTYILSGGGSSSFSLGDNVILYVRGSNNFPSFNSYTLSASSRVTYDMSGSQTVKTGFSYGSLYLDNGTKTLDDLTSGSLTINGTLYISGDATFDFSNGSDPMIIYLKGDFYNYHAVDADLSTLTLTGSEDVTFNPGGTASGRELYNLTIDKSGGKANLANSMRLDNDFHLKSGTFGMESYNRNIYLSGDWTRDSGTTFDYGTATVYFEGTSQTITGTGTDDFYNIDIAGGTKTLGSALDVNNSITIQSDGTLDVSGSNYKLNIGGTFNNNNGGRFYCQAGEIVFDGSANAYFYVGSQDSVYNFSMNKSSGSYLYVDEYDLHVGGNVNVQSGELRLGYNNATNSQYTDMIVWGNWTNNGSFRATQNDTVYFPSNSAQTIAASGADDFDHVVFSGSGTKTINSNLDVNRSIYIESGATLVVSGSNTLKVGWSFYNSGTFTCNTSTLEFDTYAGWNPVYLESNGSSIYNLVVKQYDPNYYLRLRDNLTVLNDVTVTQGRFDVTGSNYSLTVGGSWTVETDGSFYAQAGTVTFNGAGAGSAETITSNGSAFYTLTVNADGTGYYLQDEMTVNDDLNMTAGNLNLNSNDLIMGTGSGDVLTVADSLMVDAGSRLRLDDGVALTVSSGGYVEVVGADGNPALVTNQGTGTYSFDVTSGGTIAARYYTFEYMDTDGINVQNGATINTTYRFLDGTFTNGASGGTMLTVDNNQDFSASGLGTITGVSFPTNPGGTSYNVTKTQNQGKLVFEDAGGTFQGASYENDTNGLIDWSYSTTARTWTGSTDTDWDTGSNWDTGSVPGASNRVIIPGSGITNWPVITSTGDSCFHLTIESGGQFTMGDGSNAADLVVTGDLNLNGTLTFSNSGDTLYVQGNWANSGTFTHNSQGAVVFTGSDDQSIDAGGTGSGKPFYGFIIDKSGGKAILASAIKVEDNLSIIDGTLDVSSGNNAIEVLGSWLKPDSVTFLYQAGTVTFSGQDSVITGSGSDDFYNLTINASGITLGSALDIEHNLTINSSASLDASTSNYGISIQGNWSNSGTFTARGGTVIFKGTVNQSIGGSAKTTFNNLVFEGGTTITKSLSVNTDVNGNVTVSEGYFDINSYTLTGVGSSNQLTIADGARLYVGGTSNFPTGFESISLSQTSYVYYDLGGNQTIQGADGGGSTIEYGYLYLTNSGTKTANGDLDVNSSIYIANNVTFDLNSHDMNVGLYWDNNQGGTFTAGSGNTVTFDRDGTQYIYPKSSGDTFPNLVFGGTGAKILRDSITVTGDLTLNSGITYLNLETNTVTGSGSNNTLSVSSNVILYVRGADNFPDGFETINLATNSTTNYDGNLAQTVTTHDGDGDQIQYGNVNFRYNTKTLDGDLNVRGRFYVYASTTLDADNSNSYDIAVGERWYNLGTTNLYNNTVTFDGTGEQIIYSYGTTAAKKFHHLVINKPASSYLRIYNYDVQVDSNVTFTSGFMYNNGRIITVGGNWTSGSSAEMDRRGTVTFNGANQTITGSGSTDFYDVNFNGTGTKTLAGDLEVMGDLTIASGVTLDVSSNNYTLTVQGDFDNSGIFNEQQGFIVFSGTATQYIYTHGVTSDKDFYNFKVNKTGGSCYLGGHLKVNNSVFLEGNTNGIFRPDNYDITVAGSWYNSSPLRFYGGTGTVTFTGATSSTSDTIQTGYSSTYNNQFYDLVIDKSDTLVFADNIRVDNSFTQKNGTALLNGHEFYFGVNYDDGDIFGITAENGDAYFDLGTGGQLKIRGGNKVEVSSSTNLSTIRIVGTKDQESTVTYWGNTQYSFKVGSGGRIFARYYTFSYMDTAGIKIDGGQIAKVSATADTTEDLCNGTFANGVSGGRYLYINNSENHRIDSVAFITSLGTSGGHNVRKHNDAGFINFYNASGIYKGSTYEQDPYNRIKWEVDTDENQWTGTSGTNWHDTGNWSKGTVPTSSDNVVIPNVSNDPLISNSNAVCASLNIESGGLLQLGNSKSLTIGGNFQNYGTLTVFGNETISIGGDFENNATINPGTGTITMNGTTQSLNSGGTNTGHQFSSLTIANGSSVTLLNNIRAKNNITIENGATLDVSSANRAIYVGGSWSNSGTFNYRAGTVYFDGGSAQTITGSGTNDFYNIQLSSSGSKSLSGTLDINGSLTINSGTTVDAGSSTLKLGYYFYNYGTFTGNSSTVVFDREGYQGIYGDSTPTFNNLRFAGNNGKTLYNNINVNGILELKSGISYLNVQTYTVDGTGSTDTLKLESGTRLYIRGSNNFPTNFSGFDFASDSYVRYDGAMTQTIRTKDSGGNAIHYGWLEIYHPSTETYRKILENGDLYVDTRLYVQTDDTLDVSASNYNISVGENYYNYGYLTANQAAVANTVTITGSGTQYIFSPGNGTGKKFYNLTINKTSGTSVSFSGENNVYINNNLTITSGTLASGGNREIYIKGNFTCTSGTFTPSASTIHFSGTSDGTITTNGSSFYNLQVDGTSISYSLQDDADINGSLTIGSGNTLDLNGNILAFGDGSDILTVNGTLDVDAGAQLKLYNTASLVVNSGGRINVVGTSGNIARVSRNSTSGSYSFEVKSGATIAAKYYLFEYMNQSGIYINGATIDATNNFSNGTFTNGVTNGKFLSINSNTQTLTGSNKILEIQFPSNPGGTSYNVYITNSSSGSYNIEDATGDFEGDGYEYDPDGVLSWTYTTITRTWEGTTNSDWHTASNWSPKAVPSSTDKVVITSKANQPVISSSDAACKSLSLDGGTLGVSGGNNLTVSGNISIASGATLTVDSNADTVFIEGDWANSGTFNNGSGALVFQGSNSQNLTSGGTALGKRFQTLIIDKDGTSTVTLSGDNLQVDGDLLISGGGIVSGDRDIYVNGDWRNTGGTFDAGSGTVYFIGSQTDSLDSNGESFYNLTINTSSGSVRALDDIRVINDMVLTAGTFYLNGNDLSVGNASGDRISVQGTLDVNAGSSLKLKGGSAGLSIEDGGVLKAIGTNSSTLAVVTRYGTSGNYPVIFNSGSELDAKYAKFAYTNGSGVRVKSGATINTTDKLLGCVFENGTGDSYLHISNNQALGTVSDVVFGSNSTNPTYNVIYDGSGSIRFNNYKGDYAGARYEQDNGTDPTGNARWTFTETQSVTAGNTYTFGNDIEITVNTAGTLTGITVQLVDSRFNGYNAAYARYYEITTTPSNASGYDVSIKSYYADGTNQSSNEVPESEVDDTPYLWANDGSNHGPYYSSRSSADNYVVYNNATDYLSSYWYISNTDDESSLPVELASFEAASEKDGIKLTWITESELNNARWIIERSEVDSDDERVVVAEIDGQGTVSVRSEYEYLDSEVKIGTEYEYYLTSISYDGFRNEEASIRVESLKPDKFELEQNYPNPFNGTTVIRFTLPVAAKVELNIYNALGQKIRTLVNNNYEAGYHQVSWNGKNTNGQSVASGLYFYVMRSKSFNVVKKMLYIK